MKINRWKWLLQTSFYCIFFTGVDKLILQTLTFFFACVWLHFFLFFLLFFFLQFFSISVCAIPSFFSFFLHGDLVSTLMLHHTSRLQLSLNWTDLATQAYRYRVLQPVDCRNVYTCLTHEYMDSKQGLTFWSKSVRKLINLVLFE